MLDKTQRSLELPVACLSNLTNQTLNMQLFIVYRGLLYFPIIEVKLCNIIHLSIFDRSGHLYFAFTTSEIVYLIVT